MSDLRIKYNNKDYILQKNEETGYYEIELTAPPIGGIYPIEITYTGDLGEVIMDNLKVQILKKQRMIFKQEKFFMWIFSWRDFKVKDIVEIADYEIVMDEETNSNSIITVLKKTNATANDIVAIKKNSEVIYWGVINNIQNDGSLQHQYTLKYITNLFNQEIELVDEELIKTAGLEDFIANAINLNFIAQEDTFINKKYLRLKINSHTPKNVSVSNVSDNIYNLHTWMTNCTQNYNIMYEFSIEGTELVLTIENKEYKKELVDTKADSIMNYQEVFETDIVAKVTVLTSTDTLVLYLLNDRTTTTNQFDENRAVGKSTTVYTEKYEDAMQTALDVMKSNSYNHNITFNLDRLIRLGTPIAIKTKESLIFDTYISSVKITKNNFVEYMCGNIRIKFIDKLLKERRN